MLKNNISPFIWIVCIAFMSLNACRHSSITSGDSVFLCDDAISPAIEHQRREFQQLYPEAHITLQYGTSADVINRWLSGESKAMLVTRRLDSAETERAAESVNDFTVHKAALDGLAVIVNQRNAIPSLSVDQLKKIMSGEIRGWNEMRHGTQQSKDSTAIRILRESDVSGNTILLKMLGLVYGEAINEKIFIHEPQRPPSSQILEYTASNAGAIGFISAAWLNENPDYLSYYNLIRIVPVSMDEYSVAAEPIPGYVYRGDYPLRRIIYLYTWQTSPDVSIGFASFLCGNEGQKIFLDNNLVPAVNPVRLKLE